MLSSEGNVNGEKTIGCLISRKATLHVQPPFFRTFSAPFFCTTTRGNFQKLPRYTFYGKNVVPVLNVCFFFHCCSFPPWSQLALLDPSHFLTASTKFSGCSSNNKCVPCFLSLALALCRYFCRWAWLSCRVLSLFLCPSLSPYMF